MGWGGGGGGQMMARLVSKYNRPYPSYLMLHNIHTEMSLILHENEPVGGTHFHMNGFARRLVLT